MCRKNGFKIKIKMKNLKYIPGRRRPFAEDLSQTVSTHLSFSEKEVLALRKYYSQREMMYQLALLVAFVLAFFFGFSL